MKTYKQFKRELLQGPEVLKAYLEDDLSPAFDNIDDAIEWLEEGIAPIDWAQVRDRAIAAILGGLCSASTAYILFRLFE